MNLSRRQLAAVTRTGQDVCVVAGPGSGKTRVLVERFAWLVREQRFSPLRILAITFTEKAATEIKRRLAAEFSGDEIVREQIERAYVSTIHGFCGRLLREYPIEAGLDPDFMILDEPERARELQGAAHEALDGLYREHPARMRQLLEALNVTTREGTRQPDMAEALTTIYEALRTAGKSVADLRRETSLPVAGLTLAGFLDELAGLVVSFSDKLTGKGAEYLGGLGEWAERAERLRRSPASEGHFRLLEDYPCDVPRGAAFAGLRELRLQRRSLVESTLIRQFHEPLVAFLLEAMDRIDGIYRARKRDLAGLDFSDLEEKAVDLLAGKREVLEAVHRDIDQVLMDELQDTNPLQWRLMDLLRRPGCFFAVGDINQSIYGFRHAQPDIFKEYRRQVAAAGGVIDELDENYRSRQEILSAARTVLDGAAGVEAHRLEARRAFAAKDSQSVEVIAASGKDKEEAEQAEARAVARRIAEVVAKLPIEDGNGGQRLASFRDVAVLVRTLSALPPLEQAFREAGIPYLTEGGRTFFETRQARDLMQLLAVIAGPADEIALAGVLRSPLVGISDETLLRMRLAGRLEDVLFAVGTDGTEDSERLRRFATLLARMRAERDDVSPDVLLARAMDACDYEGGLDARARAGVDKFLGLLRGWRQRGPRPLDDLVKDLVWQRYFESEAEAPPDDSADVVHVMTIHKAKGLEFPVVFLPALHRGSGGTGPTIRMSASEGLGVHWRNPATGRGIKDLAFLADEQECKRREQEEENRLLFVAMTRAEEHLVLSFARTPRPQGRHWEVVAERLGVTLESDNQPPVGAVPAKSRDREGVPMALRAADIDEDALGRRSVGFSLPCRHSCRHFGRSDLDRVFNGADNASAIIAPPALRDQFDSSVPVTSIDLFAMCPRRYYLGRYLGWEGRIEATGEQGRSTGGAAQLGTAVHALLAGEPVDDAPAEAAELATRFRESDLGARAARADRAEREFDFTLAIEDVVISGQIDLWFQEGGELILVDYKTDRLQPAEAAERAERYALQLRLYALALERLLGELPNHAFLCLLRVGKVVPVALDPRSLDEAAGIVRELKQAQNDLRFELREGRRCLRCPFYGGLCPAELRD